jgi:hypothetical protein
LKSFVDLKRKKLHSNKGLIEFSSLVISESEAGERYFGDKGLTPVRMQFNLVDDMESAKD